MQFITSGSAYDMIPPVIHFNRQYIFVGSAHVSNGDAWQERCTTQPSISYSDSGNIVIYNAKFGEWGYKAGIAQSILFFVWD